MPGLVTGVNQLVVAYSDLQAGFGQFTAYMTGTVTMVQQAKAGYQQIEQSMQALIASNEDMAADVNVQTVLGVAQQAIRNLTEMEAQANTVAAQYKQAIASFTEVNNSLENVQAGLGQLQGGVNALTSGAGSLNTGLQTAANGSDEIATQSGAFVSGLAEVNASQKQLQTSLTDLQKQLTTLSKGLADSTDGLTEINDGLADANSYLADLSQNESAVFYIPQEVLEGEIFEESLNQYMSDDRLMTSMTIILDVNRYTEEAMEIGQAIREAVAATLNGTSLEQLTALLGGKTMVNLDLQEISKRDFIRSAAAMLIGIGIVLVLITRSLFQTIVVLGSLVLTTFAALGLAEIVNTTFIGANLLS